MPGAAPFPSPAAPPAAPSDETDPAALLAEVRRLRDEVPTESVRAARSAVGQVFVRGLGLEVGAGANPFPIAPGARAAYGDVRDLDGLRSYFGREEVALSARVDAQTFAGIPSGTQDFVIAAHVIEHLFDPIGSIVQAIRVLKPGGICILAVPDMRLTFDADRPETSVAHALADFADGGEGTRLQAYREHFTFVHPRWNPPLAEAEIERTLAELRPPWPDIHVHAWTSDGFAALLEAARRHAPFRPVARVENLHETIFVLKKAETWASAARRIARRLRSGSGAVLDLAPPEPARAGGAVNRPGACSSA